jgi:hypothetical protein
MAQGKRNDPTVEPSEADYWYAAGFVDGEGCITVRASTSRTCWNPSMYASVTISQVDPRPLQWFAERWGGAMRPLKRRKDGRNDRDAWEWTIVGRQAYVFLEGVRAMLKVKPEQADNALRLKTLRDGFSRGRLGQSRELSEAELLAQVDIRATALRLNGRGREWTELP